MTFEMRINPKAFLKMVKDKLRGNHINVSHLYPLQEGVKSPVSGLNEYSSQNYLFRKEKKGLFVSSSGVCNLKCSYCITSRPCINNNLNKDDFSFIFKYFGENIYFVFSGIGDFFCGYSKKDQLLRFLLQHDIMISYLDINGVDIKELEHPDLEGKEKINIINISYHFGSMKELKLINRWINSVKKIHENMYNYEIKMVMSPLERDIWGEAILFYRNEVQPITNQKLTLCPDTLVNLEMQYDELTNIVDCYKDTVDIYERERIFRGRRLTAVNTLPCPAGSRYFRIFNNGDIVPCELLADYKIKLGNLKRKELITFKRDVNCSYTGLCDCGWSTNLGIRGLNEQNEPYISQRYATYKKLQKLPLPQETNNITMNIDRLEKDDNILKIEGWAFINKGGNSEETNTYIVLKSDKNIHTLVPDKTLRPDVAAYFNNSNLYDSGFFLGISKYSLDPGEYKIGVLIKKDKTDAFQYTDKTINIGSSSN